MTLTLPLDIPTPGEPAPATGPHIVVVGSINMELLMRAERLPAPGETLFGEQFQSAPGGKGATMAVAAARLAAPGARVSFIGCVGQDALGEQLAQTLAEGGVDATHLTRVAELPSGTAMLLVDAAGQTSAVVAQGANAALGEAQVRAAWDALGKVDLLLLSLEIPLESACLAAELAEAAGVPVILNAAPAPATALPADLLRRAAVLAIGLHEARVLAGRAQLAGDADEEWALRRLRQLGPRQIAITLGERGVALLDRNFQRHRLVPKPVEVVDTVGAGACFMGALGACMAEGAGFIEAARFACDAATLSVGRAGTQAALPTREETLGKR